MRLQVGQVINNKYRLLRLIGDGGMGSVYEARHEVLGTSVALKFLHAELSKRAGLVQRFLQEARVSAQVTSPHVVRVTDVDQTPNGAFIVMEYLEGKTLQTLYEDLYKAGAQLSYTDALEYSMQMLEGVEAAHRSGIVHRDLKPDNVMITLDGRGRTLLKVLDFGIAKLRISDENDRKLTKPGVIMGTPEYMAPEQAFSADAVDARADIFSLGVMIFEMLAGRRPVGGEDAHQIATAYLSSQIARLTDLAPSISFDLAEVVHRSMAPLPSDRWPTVGAFRDAIEPFAAAARAPSAMPQTSSLSRPPATTGAMAAAPPQASPAPVPRTLPPEDEDEATPAPPQGAERVPENPEAPERTTMRDRLSRDPTPLGGFAPFDAGEAVAAGEAAPAPAVGLVPPTRSVAPLEVQERLASAMASTGLAMPVVPAAPEVPKRPGGTAVPRDPGAGPAPAMPMGTPEPTQGSSRAPVPFVPSVRGGRAQPRPGPLSSLPAILLLAAGVSAAVVGGMYLAHRSATIDDHEDPLAAAPPSTTSRSDPPLDDPSAATTPAPKSQPSRPFRPSGPYKPKGSAGPVAPPPGSSAPRDIPIIPSILPPVIIPSAFPFDFPFAPQPQPQPQPRTQPTTPRDRPPARDPNPPTRRQPADPYE